jgi:hypothetical protein
MLTQRSTRFASATPQGLVMLVERMGPRERKLHYFTR